MLRKTSDGVCNSKQEKQMLTFTAAFFFYHLKLERHDVKSTKESVVKVRRINNKGQDGEIN